MDSVVSPILIVGGIRQEVQAFADQLTDLTEITIQGLSCYRGNLRGYPCVLAVMGIGKVNAAMTTTLLLTTVQPRLIICAGGGGGLNPMLRWGDTIIVDKAIHHDYGAVRPDGMTRWPTVNPINRQENPLYLSTDANFTSLAIQTARRIVLPTIQTRLGERIPQIMSGTLASGDVFVTDPEMRKNLWQSLHADLIDMEGATVVQVARQLGFAIVIIRSISDIDENVDMDWETYFGIAARNAATIVAELIAAIDK
jgi:adenosylhomocysteine nucleosidase